MKETKEKLKEDVEKTIEFIKNSKRPVILLGNGVRQSHAEKIFFELAEKLSIPILTSRSANDLIWENHPLYVGRPGSVGQRAANFTIQNCDLLLSIGSRLSLAVIGWAYNDFAREAKKIIVDIDENELNKPTLNQDISINSDAKEFILEMLSQLKDYIPNKRLDWKEKIKHWKEKYPVVLPEYKNEKDFVNPYYFVELLSNELKEKEVIVTDSGLSLNCMMQAFKLKKGQKLFNSPGLSTSGFGLPGAIGACIGDNKKRTISVMGDGGLQKNIQELQTIKQNNLPIKIFVFDNKGYGAMRILQRKYFNGNIGVDKCSGLSIPDIMKIANSFDIMAVEIKNHENIINKIKEVLNYEGPVICNLNISKKQKTLPIQGVFNRPDGKPISRPIEDMFPYLNRDEFSKEMIIDSIPFDPYKE